MKVWISLFRPNTKIFWRKFVTRLFWGTIDFHSKKKITMEVNGAPELLCFPHSSDIFLCVQQNKDIHTGWNYLRVSKWWQNFHFWVNYPFKKRFTEWMLMLQGTISAKRTFIFKSKWDIHAIYRETRILITRNNHLTNTQQCPSNHPSKPHNAKKHSWSSKIKACNATVCHRYDSNRIEELIRRMHCKSLLMHKCVNVCTIKTKKVFVLP